MTEAAFLAQYEQTARPLKAFLTRLTGDAASAEDLLQETFYRWWRSPLPDAATSSECRAWLYRVATNLARDQFRRRKFQPKSIERSAGSGYEDAPREFPAHEPDQGDQIDARRLLSQLKPRERELIWLAYAEGFSHREISEVTGIKEASVRPLLYRIRQQLGAWLRARPAAPDAQPRVSVVGAGHLRPACLIAPTPVAMAPVAPPRPAAEEGVL